MFIRFFILIIVIFFAFSGCYKPNQEYENIRIITHFDKLEKDNVILNSNINYKGTKITEYGYCWSETDKYPILSEGNFSCNGPLKSSNTFSDTINTGKGQFLVRAYVIYNKYVVYGNLCTVTVQ